MELKFRLSMFITSFLPLWISILSIMIYELISSGIKIWCKFLSLKQNLLKLIIKNKLEITVIFAILVIIVFSMSHISNFINDKKKETSRPKALVINVKKSNKLTSEFLLAYILPMVAFDFLQIQGLILFFIYFTVLAYLCVTNNNIYTNIFLEIIGYRLYECDVERNVVGTKKIYENVLILSKQNLIEPSNRDIEYWDFENYVYINLKER